MWGSSLHWKAKLPLSNKLMRLISLLSSILWTSSYPTWSWAPGAAVWSTGWQHKAQQHVPTPAPSPSPQRRKPHRQTAHHAPTTTACPGRSWTPLLGWVGDVLNGERRKEEEAWKVRRQGRWRTGCVNDNIKAESQLRPIYSFGALMFPQPLQHSWPFNLF